MHFCELNLCCHFDLYLLIVVTFCFITMQRYDFLLYILLVLTAVSNCFSIFISLRFYINDSAKTMNTEKGSSAYPVSNMIDKFGLTKREL